MTQTIKIAENKWYMFSGGIAGNLITYGMIHALVDAACCATLFHMHSVLNLDASELVYLFILYNLLAFGTQPAIGAMCDNIKSPRLFSVIGCSLTAAGVMIGPWQPYLTVVMIGVGNSFFHVGGGSISLNLTPAKATAPGIFVAPGAMGLFLGALVGKSDGYSALLFIGLLFLSCLLIMAIKSPDMDYNRRPVILAHNYFDLIISLLLFSVLIRSLIGLAMAFPWKADLTLLMALTTGVVAGKALGGVVADRLGWIKTCVVALLVSAPLLAFGAGSPYTGIAGMFLFQMTMPVTLVAVANILPGRPGLAFGLPCLALVIGSLPVLVGYGALFNNNIFVFVVILISAMALYYSLKLLLKPVNPEYQQANNE